MQDPAFAGTTPGTISDNSLSLVNWPSRFARDALRDFISRFRSLEWMPGGVKTKSWDGDELARMYRENGWPENFNKTAFLIAKRRWDDDAYKQSEAERPFLDVRNLGNAFDYIVTSLKEARQKVKDIGYTAEVPEELEAKVNERLSSLDNVVKQLNAAKQMAKGVDPEVKRVWMQKVSYFSNRDVYS
jgi:hypothetical protein